MEGNFRQADKSGNVFVEFDCNNIILVDPNKTVDSVGKISERLVDHEDLVMYANLEAELLPRTKLAVGSSPDNITVVSIAKIDFTKPNEDGYLTTGYYDELTGKGSKDKKGTNQQQQEYIPSSPGNTAYTRQRPTVDGSFGVIDTGLLGITSINIKISGSFIPTVEVMLEDVQGRALFQLGENSPYAAFFHLPYPPFYLTIKGYYGQAIKYQLNLEKFAASFDSQSGNYKVKLVLQGYKFNILNEISLDKLLAVPHMYSSRFDITNSNEGSSPSLSLQTLSSQQSTNVNNSSNSDNTVTTKMTVEKGYQKIHEVYSDYKRLNLVDKNFPELTLQQLIDKLDMFEKNIIDNFKKTDVEPLTNIRNYTKALSDLYSQVYTNTDSFFVKNLNPLPFIEKDSGIKYYALKNEIEISQRPLVNTNLDGIIKKYNDVINNNPTLGQNAQDKIENKISIGIITATTTSNRIDWVETAKQQGILNPTISDIEKLISDNSNLFKPGTALKNLFGNVGGTTPFISLGSSNSIVEFFNPTFYVFDGQNRFIDVVQGMLAEANKKLSEYENKITNELKKRIEDPSTGIGFSPTVRNIVAVIMASTEAFLRLLDDTHTKAWQLKDDPIRKAAILDNKSSVGSDKKDVVSGVGVQDKSKIPVYPWPQFFVETGEDKKGKYQLKYVGDPTIINVTKGYLYDKWPEVEFVEEFLKGLTKRYDQPQSPTPTNINQFTNLLNINAIEFPQSDIDYSNKEEVKFFYEIWERQLMTVRYSNFGRVSDNLNYDIIKNLISDIETTNLINSLGESNPYLNYKLKNFNYNSSNYISWLKQISNNGTGQSYIDFIKDIFVTPYIKSYTDNTFAILTTQNIGATPTNKTDSSKLLKFVQSTQMNQTTITDTYPFTNQNWVTKNLYENKNKVGTQFNTSKVLQVFNERNVIANFSSITDTITNRPVTNFSYLSVQNPLTDTINNNSNSQTGFLPTFYSNRTPQNFIPTEGYCYFDVPTNNNLQFISPLNGTLPIKTTTSILNTPYFINAISDGVAKSKQNNQYPYTEAAFLFINSLPLISLKEKYKTNGLNSDELDYMFATLKKFGGVHKLPYSWILKIGSLWYRYKLEKETGVDLLSNIWKDTDYKNNFDPINKNVNKTYTLNFNGIQNNTIQLENNDGVNLTVQTGFYPKLINDFNYFYKGVDLYSTYTDSEIQTSIDNGLKIFNFTESNIITTQNGQISKNLTWSVMLPTDSGNFVVPSFGGKQNQVANSILDSAQDVLPGYSLTGNTSIYNGSSRLLWASPNYGYFDTSQIVKPKVDSYVNVIKTDDSNLSPYTLSNQDNYSKIEEIFSVFNKDILDLFESEFKNFSKSEDNIENKSETSLRYGIQIGDPNIVYTNFQMLFKQLMKLESMKTNESIETYFLNSINSQLETFNTTISKFLTFDILFKFGNPSNYNRFVFDSFLIYNPNNAPDKQISVEQASSEGTLATPKYYGVYVNNSLPSNGGTTTLAQSKANFPKEWKELELRVGFSTIPELAYGDNGSYITDFFIDNNISFNVDNIKELESIIKMYATQKLSNNSITSNDFKNQIKKYLDDCKKLENDVLNQILDNIRKKLPNYQELPQKTEDSRITGTQTKVQLWENFKALNDKWIAGSDYKTKTFFEDILFLDRASRNIGDILYLDIFSLKNEFTDSILGSSMSVYTFIAGLLIKNNFTIMNLPAYVNFYNTQNIDGLPKPIGAPNTTKFANDIWGTHPFVDYRESGPKMVCFFVGRPSSYVSLPESKNYLFRSDGLVLDCSKDNPLYEVLDDKKDAYAHQKSNRCVGFTVDIGIRNQNVFNTFSITQDNGKGTAESVQTVLNMINQTSGRETATQNVSLYNLYAQRSYGASIVCMGNAMIQPTMYFNLRHVPMFNGPYLITEVSHQIQPGTFQTSFTGVRQGVFDLPPIDSFLQSINQNLLTKIEQTVLSKNNGESVNTTTSNSNAAKTSQNSDNKKAPENSCKANDSYNLPDAVPTTATTTSITEFISQLKLETTDPDLQATIFGLCYLRGYKDPQFNSFGNNYAGVSLVDNRYASNLSRFVKSYSCVQNGNNYVPFANFDNIDVFMKFMVERLSTLVRQVKILGIHQFYLTQWQDFKIPTDNYNTNKFGLYKESFDTLYKSLTTLSNYGITPTDGIAKFLQGQSYVPPPTPTPSLGPIVVPPSTTLYTLSRISTAGNDTRVTISVAPNVGLWKITDIAYTIPSSAPCGNEESECGVKVNDTEWFVTPYQYAVDSCNDGILESGTYVITFLVGFKPILANGQPDPSRGNGQTQRFTSVITGSTQVTTSIRIDYLGEFGTVQGTDFSYRNIELNNGRFKVLRIIDPNFNFNYVGNVNFRDSNGDLVVSNCLAGSGAATCTVNGRGSGTYTMHVEYYPTGVGNSNPINLVSQPFTQ